ncbi:MAG: alpha/beta hydrolase [Rhizobiaceae bacterium]|nr:alpha/beta hydrolase [Rhizobiaceae bacterium]
MWSAQSDLIPGATYAPTLYSRGDTVADWAVSVLSEMREERIVVIGCSVGGSCALEIAATAPDRVAALVLIGTKAGHRPEPALHARARRVLLDEGIDAAWAMFWAPLFAAASDDARARGRRIARRQPVRDIARGMAAFHSRAGREHILPVFAGPIAFVSGDEDTAPGPDASARQAGLARRGSLHVIDNCGHYAPMERPGAFNTLLRGVIAAQES